MDNLTISAIVVAIILFLAVILTNKQKVYTDKKIKKMAKQFTLIQYNDKAKSYCRRIHEKYPDLCAGIDYTLKEKGGNVVIDKWNSDQPRPDL